MTRDQLKEEAKKRGLQKYHNLGKTELIKLIVQADFEAGVTENPADELNAKEAEELANKPAGVKELSPQAVKWKEYFEKTQTTAANFLARYPNHKFKVFISELL